MTRKTYYATGFLYTSLKIFIDEKHTFFFLTPMDKMKVDNK